MTKFVMISDISISSVDLFACPSLRKGLVFFFGFLGGFFRRFEFAVGFALCDFYDRRLSLRDAGVQHLHQQPVAFGSRRFSFVGVLLLEFAVFFYPPQRVC